MNREDKKKQTRSRLIESAIELFEEHGYETTTVQQIASRAGVAKGTFFNYFESKEDMILELQGFMLIQKLETKRGVPGSIVGQMLEVLTDYARQYPMTASVTRAVLQGIYGSAKIGKAQSERSGIFRSYLSQIISRGQEVGEIRRDLTAEHMAGMAVRLYYGVLMFWVLEQEPTTLEEQMSQAFYMLADGIRA